MGVGGKCSVEYGVKRGGGGGGGVLSGYSSRLGGG